MLKDHRDLVLAVVANLLDQNVATLIFAGVLTRTVGTDDDADDQASRKRRLLKGPEEFRELRVDRLKAKGK